MLNKTQTARLYEYTSNTLERNIRRMLESREVVLINQKLYTQFYTVFKILQLGSNVLVIYNILFKEVI